MSDELDLIDKLEADLSGFGERERASITLCLHQLRDLDAMGKATPYDSPMAMEIHRTKAACLGRFYAVVTKWNEQRIRWENAELAKVKAIERIVTRLERAGALSSANRPSDLVALETAVLEFEDANAKKK